LFRGLKLHYKLDKFDTNAEHVVRILPYAAFLSLFERRNLLDLVTEQVDDEFMSPTERGAVTFQSHTQLILHELSEYPSYSPPCCSNV